MKNEAGGSRKRSVFFETVDFVMALCRDSNKRQPQRLQFAAATSVFILLFPVQLELLNMKVKVMYYTDKTKEVSLRSHAELDKKIFLRFSRAAGRVHHSL